MRDIYTYPEVIIALLAKEKMHRLGGYMVSLVENNINYILEPHLIV
jgi:hypothetical protein